MCIVLAKLVVGPAPPIPWWFVVAAIVAVAVVVVIAVSGLVWMLTRKQ
jgi:hypothetical protein